METAAGTVFDDIVPSVPWGAGSQTLVVPCRWGCSVSEVLTLPVVQRGLWLVSVSDQTEEDMLTPSHVLILLSCTGRRAFITLKAVGHICPAWELKAVSKP